MAESPSPEDMERAHRVRNGIRSLVYEAYQDERGVHAETILSALGGLAGFAVQEGLRQKLIREDKQPEDRVFVKVETKKGETYYFGPLIDEFLLTAAPEKVSVWSIVAAGAQHAGAKELPDIARIAQRNAQEVGSPIYGDPPGGWAKVVKEKPIDTLRRLWPSVKHLLKTEGMNPVTWGWEIAAVAQNAIVETRELVTPPNGAALVMNAAIAMSKVNPRQVLPGVD